LKPIANRFFFLIAKMQSSPANCCVDPGIMGQIVAQVPCAQQKHYFWKVFSLQKTFMRDLTRYLLSSHSPSHVFARACLLVCAIHFSHKQVSKGACMSFIWILKLSWTNDFIRTRRNVKAPWSVVSALPAGVFVCPSPVARTTTLLKVCCKCAVISALRPRILILFGSLILIDKP
jgi:hypothetical protein